jgi:MFS family permease
MKESRSVGWMYPLIPISAISTGLSILIPLYILSINGNVFDVGIAVAIFSVISLVSLPFWGDVTDKAKSLKSLILLSIFGIFPLLVILYMIRSIGVAYAIYGLYAFVATAASPSINILVMGRKKDAMLPKYVEEYSLFILLGSLIGLIPGTLLGKTGLYLYLAVLFLLNLVALIFAYYFVNKKMSIRQTSKKSKKENMMMYTASLLSYKRMHTYDQRFVKRLHSLWKNKNSRSLVIIIISIAVFNFSQYLFSTSYIPYLVKLGISNGNIFILSIGEIIGQISIYAIALYAMEKFDPYRNYLNSGLIRILSIILILFIPIFLSQAVLYMLYINLAGYFMYGIAFALWNIAASVLLFDHFRKKSKQGHKMGIFLAIVGMSSLIGALISGLFSSVYGYTFTFLASIVFSLIAVIVMELLRTGFCKK